MEGAFNTLPFPMQLMLFRKMQQEQQQAQQMRAARGQAGQVLYDQFGGGQQPQPQLLPPPGAQPPMALQPPAPAAPPPGTLSPGGGNPQAQGGMPPPPQQGAPQQPMVMTGQGGIPNLAQQAGALKQAPTQIPPFRPMPTEQPQPPGIGGKVPPPPMAAPAGGDASEPRGLDLKSIVLGLKNSGVPPEQVMNVLDTLTPTMNAQNQREVAALKAETAANAAATRAYAETIRAFKAQEEVRIKDEAEARRREGEARRKGEAEMKGKLIEARIAALAGGDKGIKKSELLYAPGADGKPDMTAGPIGVRAITKTGRIIFMDAEGRQVPSITGATAAESKASSVSVRDTVRSNLVEGSAFNALNRLDEIEKAHPKGTVSILFGKSPGDSLLMGAGHAAVRGTQDKTQQDIDAKWSAFIDEAIPVFTGGLRGSDAFRKFLIEQAPQPGAKPEVIAEKLRLFRENIAGTRQAFKQKFISDPSMWGAGVTPEQVKGRGTAPKPAAKPPAVNAVQDGYRFKGGDPSKPESWEKVR